MVRSGLLTAAASLLVAFAQPLSAQVAEDRGSIVGIVIDSMGVVAGATVRAIHDGTDDRIAGSGDDGRFELADLPAGSYVLDVSRIGYRDAEWSTRVEPGDRTEVELELEPRAIDVRGISVDVQRTLEQRRLQESAGVTVRSMTRSDIVRLPGLAESDPLRAVAVLPGVVTTSDFSSSFHVRGGSADQNLILLDGAPVFSPFHLGGLFSVFNPDMVERTDLILGGMPADYGGRVSSVLAVTTDPGDGELRADVAVSALSARLALAGGIGRSFRWRVAGRRSYLDQVLEPFTEFPYHMRDLQGVAEMRLGESSRLRATAYSGKDVLDLTRLDEEDFPLRADWRWGNDVVGLTWERDGSIAWQLTGSLSSYDSELLLPDFDDTRFASEVRQTGVRGNVGSRIQPWLELRLGGSIAGYEYDNVARTGGTDLSNSRGDGTLSGAFLQADWGRPERWSLETGLRVDRWARHGQGMDPIVELSPRLAARRYFSEGLWALTASAGRYTQFIHSLRDEDLPLGLDTWILPGRGVPHVVSDQAQIGLEIAPGGRWSATLEGYVREFDGVVSVNTSDDPNDEYDEVSGGFGRSWGGDLMIRRDGSGVSGWLALSYLKADRTFPDPLTPTGTEADVSYPPVFDRRVDADLVLRFSLPGELEAGLRFNLGTGTPFTRPIASYADYRSPFLRVGGRFFWTGDDDSDGGADELGGYAVLLEDRNQSRYPAYHRLDLSLRRTFQTSWGSITPHFDILNAYNQTNVLFYFYEYDRDPPVRTGLSMLPIVPTIGVEARFW